MSKPVTENKPSGSRRRVALWAAQLATGPQSVELRTHLGDLYAACGDVVNKLEQLSQLDPVRDADSVRRLLAQLEGQLYEHVLPHLQELRPTLSALTSHLYAQAEKEGRLS
jgi:uncharacterized membrane protein YccC